MVTEARREYKTAYQRRWLAASPENKAAHAAKVRAREKRLREEQTAILNRLRDAPCSDCGDRFPPECYDFDHVRGKKDACVAERVGCWSTARLLAEVEKCDLVCANCHRIRTMARRRSQQDARSA